MHRQIIDIISKFLLKHWEKNKTRYNARSYKKRIYSVAFSHCASLYIFLSTIASPCLLILKFTIYPLLYYTWYHPSTYLIICPLVSPLPPLIISYIAIPCSLLTAKSLPYAPFKSLAPRFTSLIPLLPSWAPPPPQPSPHQHPYWSLCLIPKHHVAVT